MTKITWSCTPFKGGYIITASQWVRGRETRADLAIPAGVVPQEIPARAIITASMDGLLQALAELAKAVPAVH